MDYPCHTLWQCKQCCNTENMNVALGLLSLQITHQLKKANPAMRWLRVTTRPPNSLCRCHGEVFFSRHRLNGYYSTCSSAIDQGMVELFIIEHLLYTSADPTFSL